jgi:hypothetical protein
LATSSSFSFAFAVLSRHMHVCAILSTSLHVPIFATGLEVHVPIASTDTAPATNMPDLSISILHYNNAQLQSARQSVSALTNTFHILSLAWRACSSCIDV